MKESEVDLFTREDAEQSIAGRFEQVAGRQPRRIALKGEDEVMTYGELDERANRLANAMTEVLVGDRGDRGLVGLVFGLNDLSGIVISHLACLKAGKIGVGLNSMFPFEYILRDLKPGLVITDNENRKAVVGATKGFSPFIWDCEIMSNYGSANSPQVYATGDYISYITYTSGSTGAPKGTVHIQRSDVLLARNEGKLMGLTGEDRCTMLRYNSGGLNDMFTCLLNGAQLTSCDIFDEYKLGGLSDWINEEGITYLKTVSTAYRMMLQARTGMPNVRIVNIGGEMVIPPDFKGYAKYFSDDARLAVRYGATEGHVLTYYLLTKEDEDTVDCDNGLPVGWPLEHNEIFVLDEGGLEVHDGRRGEIVIAGEGVGLGYYENVELTKKKFFTYHGKRAYRTGDLGWKDGDGCLMHCGRLEFAQRNLL